MSTHPLAGKPTPRSRLVNVPRLVAAYYTTKPDQGAAEQRVAFGTSGHRGSSLRAAFNQAHILAITQAICLHRAAHGIDGPLYLGKDTHAPEGGAPIGGLKVVTANGWFAACPPGAADVHKIYAESFVGPEHLAHLQQEAHALIGAVFEAAGARAGIRRAEVRPRPSFPTNHERKCIMSKSPLPKSLRKYLRRAKSRIRLQAVDSDEAKRKISALVADARAKSASGGREGV